MSDTVVTDIAAAKAASRRLGLLAAVLALIVLAFAGTLADLVRRALADDLASHTILIPFVSAWLVWSRTRSAQGVLETVSGWQGGARWPGVLLALAGFAVLMLPVAPENQLSARVFALCLLVWAAGFACLGSRAMRAVAFPAVFLLFMVPLPTRVIELAEAFFQHTSGDLAYRFIAWSATPIYRDGLTFMMPTLTVFVAPECSGIRSSYVLFITAVLAGHLFLRSPWRRLALAAFVIPLGIVRNAFRVFVISMLTVHVDPWYIDSPLHHSGGPIFFVLSLVPFFLFLWWLRRADTGPADRRGDSHRLPAQ